MEPREQASVSDMDIGGMKRPAPRRPRRRVGTAALLALTLAGGAVGGGAIGTVAAAHWLLPATASAAVITAQPIAQVAATTNVAGAVAAAVGSAVVEITTSAQIGMRGGTATGTGSGFVVDASGLILTNNHVVENATQVEVQFSSGETRTATVVGTDSTNDLALIKVSDLPDGVAAVTLGDSDAVEVGETAIAIGSPFGLEQTVTQGIVSAVDRDWSSNSESLSNLLQTDTPINPGNSGGPLLNAAGEVIGINTLIESPVEGNVGVGFAVPINVAKQQLSQLETGADIEQGYLGVSVGEAADGAQGVVVGAVESGSGAAVAGVAVGDVITAVDGNAITDYSSLAGEISGKQPGVEVAVTVTRGGETIELAVTLQARTTQ